MGTKQTEGVPKRRMATGSRKPAYEDLPKLQARGPGGHILAACFRKLCASAPEEQA